MGESTEFSIRPLPKSNTLDGAFRVHISSKDLEALALKAGDVCILRAAGGITVPAVAWRSADSATKTSARNVKVTDVLREVFELKVGQAVLITKSSSRLKLATSVAVRELSEDTLIDPSKDDNLWRLRIAYILTSIDAIASGTIFEVVSKKGLRKRFVIDQVHPGADDDRPFLYHADGETQFSIANQQEAPSSPVTEVSSSWQGSFGDIRGLGSQIENLTSRINFFRNYKYAADFTDGVLLYGPSGTGKGMITSRLAELPWKKVLYIDRSTISGTSARSASTISGIFADASAQQPSLIIISNLQQIAGTQGDDVVADCLALEFEKKRNAKIFIIATAPHPNTINETLREAGKFGTELEIPPPVQQTRVQILKDLHDRTCPPSPQFNDVAEEIGGRTHGYTGADLHSLHGYALRLAWKRATQAGPNGVEVNDQEQAAESGPEEATPEVTLADFRKAMLDIRPTAMKEVFIDVPKVHWSQIGGCADTRQLLTEAVEWPLKYPDILSRLGISAQKGILLYGPPGCSKTMTAQAIATSSGLNFLAVKGAELISMYVGESERAVREVFRKARAAAPSIIFFDEIDSIGGSRDGPGHTGGLNVLTTLLNEMDGIEGLSGVLVLAATNRPDSLDPALLRPGRFDNVLYIAPPDRSARRDILRIVTANVPRAPDLDENVIIDRTEGFSGADVTNVCRNAALVCARRAIAAVEGGDTGVVSQVSNADFEAALRDARSSIPPEMVEGFERWRAGL